VARVACGHMTTDETASTPDDPHLFFGSIAQGAWSDPAHPSSRLARALVRLATVALDKDTPPEVNAALLAHVEAFDHGDASLVATRYRAEDVPAGQKVRPNATGKHPLAGPANPVAPPITLHREGDHAVGEVTYDLRFEGLPGLVQGGFIAAAFDLLLGQAVAISGSGGMTGGLSVRYVSPTPLYEPLRYESWIDRVDGRKAFAKGRLVLVETERVCAEAEGVFIAPRTGPATVD
jgi:acyl-coenzyme A thioesterase PaaI-like protein